MVKTAQLNSLGFTEFLLRVRPGVAISVAAHVALILFLAYILAFPPGDPPARVQESESIEVIAPPPPPMDPVRTAMETVKPFKVEVFKQFKNIQTDFHVEPFPPRPNDESPQTSVTVAPPAPPVIVNPTPISRGGLFYPDRAAERNITGYVDFSFIIKTDGSVGDPQIIGEVPEGYGFAAAALKAFARWKFEPKRVDGVAVPAPAKIRITFQMK
jgi:protein TonB